MPKIQDLGINRIPSTMQPPAVGEGGGPDPDLDYTASQEGSAVRSANSCPVYEEETQEARAFTPDAVAQLRQQIERMSANV